MLVRFRSNVGDITMFGDIAVRLIRMMGHSGTVPSALLAAGVPEALAKLRSAVAGAGEETAPGPGERKEEGQPAISLRQRAYPLIELLERCVKEECDLTWEAQRY